MFGAVTDMGMEAGGGWMGVCFTAWRRSVGVVLDARELFEVGTCGRVRVRFGPFPTDFCNYGISDVA